MSKIKRDDETELMQPTVRIDDLQSIWIGMGGAIDWIALRGQECPIEHGLIKFDEAEETLVRILADLPPDIAESIVHGLADGADTLLKPIPAGIWKIAATSDANDEGQPYRFIGTDEHDELAGSILSVHAKGYRRIQIRTAFVRDNWPEHKNDIEPLPIRQAVSRAEVRRLIEKFAALTSSHMEPPTQSEMIDLVKEWMPDAQRDLVRKFYKELWPNAKAGPRGPRNPERKLQIQELREKMIAAQLHN